MHMIFCFWTKVVIKCLEHSLCAELKHSATPITLQDSLHMRSPYTRLTPFVCFCSRQLNECMCVGLNEITTSNYQYPSLQLSRPTACMSLPLIYLLLNLHLTVCPCLHPDLTAAQASVGLLLLQVYTVALLECQKFNVFIFLENSESSVK